MKSYRRFSSRQHIIVSGSLFLAAFWLSPLAQAASPTAEQALKLAPTQEGVEYDRPKAEDVARCKIVPETVDGHVGWVVQGPDGNILRRFVDTNGDNIVDQWSYYKDGIEVYRDVATRTAGKADQFRWLNTGGIRWGEDLSGSGKLEKWKAISAEEVSAEIVAAIARRDVNRFNRLLLTPEELAALGLGKVKTAAIEAKLAKAKGDFQSLVDRQRAIGPASHWLQFSGNRPGVVPAGTEDSTKDVEVYENTLAVFEGGERHGQIQIGTMIHVDKVWKVIDVPVIAGESNAETVATGLFFQPASVSANAGIATSPELASTDPSDPKRIEILEGLVKTAKTTEERNNCYRQLADTIGAAMQAGKLADGDKRLKDLFEEIQTVKAGKAVAGYVKIRLLSAEYAVAIQQKGADVAAIQVKWVKSLEEFVEEYPDIPDTAEALLQLGIAREYAGQDDDAKKWYERVVREFHDAPQAKKAAGAVVRLDSIGKVLRLSGAGLNGGTVDLSSYRGRVIVLQYWATWSAPAKSDLESLKKLSSQLGNSLAIVGVSVDNNAKDVRAFLKENPLPWPQIFEEGGQDSRPANALGVISVPTMILLDADGKVVDRNVQMADLESAVKKLVK